MPVSKGRPSPGEPRTGDLLVVPASELDTAQFSQLDIIYEQAFPARLRVPLTELAAPSPRDQLLAALAKGYIRHDVYVQEIWNEFHDVLQDRYGPGMQQLVGELSGGRRTRKATSASKRSRSA